MPCGQGQIQFGNNRGDATFAGGMSNLMATPPHSVPNSVPQSAQFVSGGGCMSATNLAQMCNSTPFQSPGPPHHMGCDACLGSCGATVFNTLSSQQGANFFTDASHLNYGMMGGSLRVPAAPSAAAPAAGMMGGSLRVPAAPAAAAQAATASYTAPPQCAAPVGYSMSGCHMPSQAMMSQMNLCNGGWAHQQAGHPMQQQQGLQFPQLNAAQSAMQGAMAPMPEQPPALPPQQQKSTVPFRSEPQQTPRDIANMFDPLGPAAGMQPSSGPQCVRA